MSSLRIALLLLLCSCATAADSDNGPAPDPDANSRAAFPDAGPKADAGPLPDAAQPLFPDAAPGTPDAASGPFCEDSGDCTVSGECCFSLGGPGFCRPGNDDLGVCVPN